MAREFVRVLDEGGRLLLEGGTGVGKSLAYLAALIPYAMERAAGGIREPLIVSTRTKLLQDQLLAKDIPAAAAHARPPRTARALDQGPRQLRVPAPLPAGARRGQRAAPARGGPRRVRGARLRGEAAPARRDRHPARRAARALPAAARPATARGGGARRALHARAVRAASARCPFGRRRKALADAHLVVANHDLLLRWPPDYPAFTVAIVDEAHELAGVADEVYAAEVRPEEVLARVDDLYGTGAGAARSARASSRDEARVWRADLAGRSPGARRHVRRAGRRVRRARAAAAAGAHLSAGRADARTSRRSASICWRRRPSRRA